MLDWLRKTRYLLPIEVGKILELGSLDVNGTPREVYGTSGEYFGIDIEFGKGVDLVMNANDIITKLGFQEFDLVICMNLIEHDQYFWKTLEGIKHVLKPGGYFIYGTPTFAFPIHRYPKDYYRFGEDAVREVIMDGFEILNLEEVFTKELDGKPINPTICAIGRKL